VGEPLKRRVGCLEKDSNMKLIIRSMMTCCVLFFFICASHGLPSGNAQNQKTSKQATNTLEPIPDPKMEEIRRISRENWPNPIVIVNADSFYLILGFNGERVREELNLADLEKKLKELKLDRWLLGRVVAVEENGLRSPGDNEKIAEKAKEVKQMLESHKVMIELWPSG
jgi:hypothetical protein